MKDDLADIESRLRATYRAVAAATVLEADDGGHPAPLRHDLDLPREPRRPRRLVATMTMAAAVIAGVTATVVLIERDRPSATTQVATQPAPTEALRPPDTTEVLGSEPTCGSQLPRPVDVPDGYRGPERVASSVPGQLVVQWTSATGRIEARWPADPQYQQLAGGTIAPTPDGQASVARASTSQEVQQTASGTYHRSTVFGLRNVASECRSLQVDLMDNDRSRVEAATARLANRGLFVSTTPLVTGSENRAVAPAVIPCNPPAGAPVPPKRGGPVTGGQTHPTPTAALQAFLDADPSLLRDQYLEIRLPDGSLAYAREAPARPDVYVTVIHVVQTAGGWSVDRWESSGC